MLFDHTTTPPTPHTPPCLIRGIGVSATTDLRNLPAGVYVDGGADPIPDGHYATRSWRTVVDGKSILAHELAPIPPDTNAIARDTAKATYTALLAGLGLTAAATDEDVADKLFDAKAGNTRFPLPIKGKTRQLEAHEYSQMIQSALRNYERRGGDLFALQAGKG